MNNILYLYLTTTGWQTGNAHEIEIWFVVYEGRFYLISELYERSHWVQNIRRDPAVSFRVDGQSYRGKGRVIEAGSEPEREAAVGSLMAGKYGWNTGLIVELAPA